MNDPIDVDGEIDASFQSYGVPKQDSSDMNGEIKTETYPEHLDLDELTDKQREVVEIAFGNPTLTTSEIDERIGSDSYAYKVLSQKVPEWYENVFKSHGKSKNYKDRDLGRTTTESDTETVETTDTGEESDTDTLRAVIEAMKATAQNEETVEALEVVEGHL